MRTKKILLEETAKRYCWASKKEKTKIIDEFTATTGYNRKYAIHVLKETLIKGLTPSNSNFAKQSFLQKQSISFYSFSMFSIIR